MSDYINPLLVNRISSKMLCCPLRILQKGAVGRYRSIEEVY